MLEAAAGEFGVRLPRHAIVHGRLHTFTARSWTRPPKDGEAYAEVRLNRNAPHAAGSEPGEVDPLGSR